MAATPRRRRVAVANVPCCGLAPAAGIGASERGNISYQAENSARLRSTQSGYSCVLVTTSRTGCCQSSSARSRAGETRSNSGRLSSRSAFAAETRADLDFSGTVAIARSRISAPSARSLARSSAPCPASIFFSTASFHVRYGSSNASTVKLQRPSASGRIMACQVSVPGSPGRILVNGPSAPSGPRRTTLHPSAWWPSRYARADTGTSSPTTALAARRPQPSAGLTSSIMNRPTVMAPCPQKPAANSRSAPLRDSCHHPLSLADDDDPAFGDGVPGAVLLQVDPDLHAFRDDHVLVDDGVADHRVAADVDTLHEHRALDVRPGVDMDVGGHHRVLHQRAGDDGPRRDHRPDRPAQALLVPVDELRRRPRPVLGVDRPLVVVEVEDRADRDGVAAHVVLAQRVLGVPNDRVAQRPGGEAVVAHRREDLVGRVWQALGVLGLLPEQADPPAVLSDLDDAELVGQGQRLADRGDGDAGTRLDVLGDHLRGVHPVHVVGAE